MAFAHFDWSNYFKLADELSKRTDDAALRSAISRGYYYVYHLALHRAKANGFALNSDEPSHAQLWKFFTSSPEADCRKLALIGDRLKRNRTRADYQPIFTRLLDEASAAIADVQDFEDRMVRLDPRLPAP